MKKSALTGILTLALALGLAAPAGAFEAGAVDAPTSLGVSGTFSAVVDEDGTLWTWGNNNYGQLGNDNQGNVKNDSGNPEQNVPTPILEEIRSVAVGGFHGAAIKEDGTLWTWGCNDNGQVGQKRVNDKDVIWYWTFIIPHRIVTPYQTVPVQIMEDVAAVACGAYHTLILKTDGTLWACGHNGYGQLGAGDTTDRDDPVQVMTDVAAISAGFGFSAALKTDGSLWTWGRNDDGQLGTGDTQDRSEPVQVMDNVAQISAGSSHMVAIKTDGTLWTWGVDRFNQLGTGQPLAGEDETRFNPQPTQVLEDAAFVAAGTYNTLAAKTDGSLWIWGTDIGLILCGIGDLENADGNAVQPVPASLPVELRVAVSNVNSGK